MAKKQKLEQIVEQPAVGLEKAINTVEGAARSVLSNKPVKGAEKYWHNLGPGLTTGASDDDPAGIATYSQTGAQYGFQLLWLAAFTFPLMGVVQEMCARIGLVTGRGLAGNIREHYSRWILYGCVTLLFAANTFNLGADLGAMAKATQLIFPNLSYVFLVILFTALSLGLQIFTTYQRFAHYLKYLALILLLYIFATLSIKGLEWGEIMRQAVIPSLVLSKEQIFLVCGILGTTISPYLFFWQTSQEVEERALRKSLVKPRHDTVRRSEIKKMRIDVWSGMFLSNLVMFFIITACGATLFAQGATINTAADAASALRPIAGEAAYLFFALGIIGTGMLAVPVLAGSAAYALAESFHWKYGLYRKLPHARAFYGVIIIAMVIGLLMNFTGIDPIKALLYSAVANGLVAPIVLIFIVQLSSDKTIMGKHANSLLTTLLGWLIVGIMAAIALVTIVILLS
jgi:NRAMP (natural resistance-associated macrophage protein)-like metal ion transporter